MGNSERLKVAVIGGGIGQNHIRAFQSLPEQFELMAICDIDEAKAQKIAAEFGIPQVYTDFSTVCRRDDLDVVDICTPPFLHFRQITEGLEAGKHVICEKPLVGSVKEVDDLISIEAKSGKRMMPIFQYRFGSGLQKLKYLVGQGLAGTAYLSTVETAWRRRADYYAVPWRGKWNTELGGALLSHAIHAHDMLCYVVGPIRKVFARTTTRVNPIEVEDCAAISLEMADGSLATLAVTLGSPVEITRHRFCFSEFVAESNLAPYTNSADPWTFSPDNAEAGQKIEAALAQYVPQPEAYAGQFTRFYTALQQNSVLPVALSDARASLELVTALYYSAETGHEVSLPITAEHPRYTSWLPERVRTG